MKLAIMQPYFFPYLGYFDLIHNVDLFIVYDTVQYIRRGWINRNRVFHQSGTGWQYITIPVEHAPQKTPICEIQTSQAQPWQGRIMGQLAHYKTRAAHADEVLDFVGGCLFSTERSIARLNVSTLEHCCRLLGVDFRYKYSSQLDVQLDPDRNAEDRILDLCTYLGATEYVNLPGGVNLYDQESFAKRGIRLTFRNLPALVYDTPEYSFEPNLSIIDLLMWNESQEIRKHLDDNRHA